MKKNGQNCSTHRLSRACTHVRYFAPLRSSKYVLRTPSNPYAAEFSKRIILPVVQCQQTAYFYAYN